MHKIQLLNHISPTGLSVFDRESYLISEKAENPDGILVRSACMHGMVFPKSLLAIARAGVGINNIPVDACAEQGIVVFNTPGANANAVKELTIAALLLSSRKIISGIEWAKTLKGKTGEVPRLVEADKSRFVGPEIEGKTLGVIGLGAVGVMVANAAQNLGMNVYGYDPYISIDAAWGLSRNVHKAVNLATIYEQCDYISLHVPLTPETEGILNPRTFKAMKPGMKVLNFSRGELVSTGDLKEALAEGHISVYVTDFPTDDILGLENVIAIPHLGASTPESEENCAVMAARELKAYLEEGIVINSVNLPTVDMPRNGHVRVCIIHRNIPKMINSFTDMIGQIEINIENLVNKSKKDFAYTLLDLNADLPDGLIEKIRAMDGVCRVRKII
jgi:D-3-phosphoglycerate dehydrogenase